MENVPCPQMGKDEHFEAECQVPEPQPAHNSPLPSFMVAAVLSVTDPTDRFELQIKDSPMVVS